MGYYCDSKPTTSSLLDKLNMIRITEIKLPLDHPPSAIVAAVIKKLGINATDLVEYSIFKRGVDARKADAILLAYTLDVTVNGETKVLAKLKKDPHVKLAPDTSYHFVAQAPADLKTRPIVVGLGPSGLFAALVLAQSGFKPLVLELSLIHI